MADTGHHNQRHRFLSVDSLRGLAMVLVILQHSYSNVNENLVNPFVHMVIMGVTSCAAVAFVSISGMVFSYFLYLEPDWKSRYKHYCKRAALLLLAVHPLVKLMSSFARLIDSVNPQEAHLLFSRLFLEHSSVTDTIGVCILISPLLILFVGSMTRAAIIMIMLVATIFINSSVIPSDPLASTFKEAIFGSLGSKKLFWFSLVPWLSIFLTGSYMGHALMRLKTNALTASDLIHRITRAGITLAVLSGALTAVYYALKIILPGFSDSNFLLAAHPGQTTTLLPGYLATILFALTILLKRINILGKYGRISWLLSILGRTSLFTFVAQFAVVKGIPELLGYKDELGLGGFFMVFALGQAALLLLAYAYGRLRGWISAHDYEDSLRVVEQPYRMTKAA